MKKEFLSRAQYHIKNNQLQNARHLLLEVICEYQDCVEALNDLAVIEIMEGKLQSGYELLNEVLIIDPQNEDALNNLRFVKDVASQM